MIYSELLMFRCPCACGERSGLKLLVGTDASVSDSLSAAVNPVMDM